MGKAVATLEIVMPGLDPGIHDFPSDGDKRVDGRVKPGHDVGEIRWQAKPLRTRVALALAAILPLLTFTTPPAPTSSSAIA